MTNLTQVPGLSKFQRGHVGTTVTGLSGIVPYAHKKITQVLKPIKLGK